MFFRGLVPSMFEGTGAYVTLLERKGPARHLGCQWSHTDFLTLHCSARLAQFTEYSSSLGKISTTLMHLLDWMTQL